jgi:cellulose synthase operon protein C
MTLRCNSTIGRSFLPACFGVLFLSTGFFAVNAQQRPAAASGPEKTRQTLINNAHAQENRGRPDLAVQVWQQVLFSDAKNEEALVGMARDYKLLGKTDEANAALAHLRSAYPNDPNIAKIQALSSVQAQGDQLRQAGDLARAGKNDDAMRAYRAIYGDRPPDGDIALAYYQTLYGATGGKQQAIAGIRGLMQRNPGDPRYAIVLGKMLTYDPGTRAEGVRILMGHQGDPDASEGLRQALVWESDNPNSAGQLRDYLKTHPNDTELTARLKDNEQKLAQMNSGIARTPEERAAFAALNAKKLSEAEQRFNTLLQKDPKNGRAAAGMGFLRMQQNNFGGAVSYLTQAEQNGFRDKSVTDALTTSRFWFTMGEASQAVDENQLELAASKYNQALSMRAGSPEALNGLAGLYVKEEQYSHAAEVYSRLLKAQPKSADAWRGLFLSYARDGQNEKALALAVQLPPAVKTSLDRDPDYLRTLAVLYNASGRPADAQNVLAQALSLPFPQGGATLKADTRLQYAGILMEARRYSQAATLYTQILQDDATNLSAWMGLVSAHHTMGQDEASIADVEKMPPTVYEQALNDANFLSLLGSIYQQAGRYDIAQQLIERAGKLQAVSGEPLSIQMQIQLAGIYLQRNNTDQAYGIYRQILLSHPDRAEAWKGLITALQSTGHTNEALQQIAYIPPAVRAKLEADPQFVQAEASLYAAGGNAASATEAMNRLAAYYLKLGQPMPADLAIQNAWVLYNTKNERALYPALMRLGGRADLTVAQREQTQTIWASWSVQRAGTAFDAGNNERAVEILEAAVAAFPDNIAVKRVLAGGYLRVGEARASLAIYKSLPNDDATAADFQGAVSAALAAGDKSQAEEWLRQALERYPNDYRVLGAAARFEQARGDNERAADYWRAALASLPPRSPTDRLAHELAYPDADTKPRKAATAKDLARLLNPDDEPFARTVQLPPLPSYGPDPYLGKAPVVLPDSAYQASVPLVTQVPVPAAPTQTQALSQTPTASSDTTQPASKHHRKSASSRLPAPSTYQGQSNPPATGQTLGTYVPSSPATPSTLTPLPPTPQSSQPVFIPSQPSSAAPSQPSQLYLPGQSAPPNQPPTAPLIPQAMGPTPRDYDLQTGLKLSDPEQQAAERLKMPQTTSVVQMDAQIEAPIRPIENAPLALPAVPLPIRPDPQPVTQDAVATNFASMEPVQYTPSAKDAATGAYSAPQQTQTQTQKPAPATAEPVQQPAPKKKRKKAAPQATPAQTQTVPTLATAPTEAQAQVAAPVQQPASPGLSDEDLQQQSLPPLRGPWIRVQRQPQPIDPRTEVERQLQSLESSYSAWLGGTGLVNYRSGNLGYDRLTALEAPFEASVTFGYNGRLTFIAKPVFLDSGQATGTAQIQVQESTNSGNTLVNIPEPLGTATNTGANGTTGATGNPPPQQNASGVAGEVQVALPHLALAAGYSPYGFLVSNWTARGQWKPGGGPFTITASRDSVKETQLSYGGLRDPGSASLGFPGNIWGAVMSNQANVQFSKGDALSGYYASFGGQYLNGYHTESNTRFDGTGGAYWRVYTLPEYGSLTLGANFFGMHYAHNESAYTYGMGGYFSPQFYFLATIPFAWTGHAGTRLHYEINGGVGIQAFQEDKTPLFPLAAQKPLEVSLNNAALPALTTVGANYSFRGAVAHQLGSHWFVGGFLSANNTSNYNAVSAGFSVHYLFRAQAPTAASPTGLFPTDGLRPFSVP